VGTGASSSASAAVTPTIPTMSLDRTALNFAATSNGAAFTSGTTAQTIRLTQSGGGTVTWTAASNRPWLTVLPASGTGSATLTIATQFATGLAGSQTGAVTLAFTGAGNSPGPIGVTLTTLVVGTSTAPTGSFRHAARRDDRRHRVDCRDRLVRWTGHRG
jgi:hypothetical protein